MNILEQIINQMEAGANDKTASATETAPPAPVPANLEVDAQLRDALEKVASVETPAAATPIGDPVDALMQMAQKLASAEQAASLAEANMLGAALCDGFTSKLAAYENAATQANIVVQAPQAPQGVNQLKQAAQMGYASATEQSAQMPAEDLRKLAAEAGYQNTLAKVAETYQAGHDNALQQVADGLGAEFYKGAQETAVMLKKAMAQPAAQ